MKPFDKPLGVIIENERIHVSLSEIVKRTDHKPTAAEASKKAQSWYAPRWDYTSTGDLKSESHLQNSMFAILAVRRQTPASRVTDWRNGHSMRENSSGRQS